MSQVSPSRASGGRAGFTLLEVLLVLALFAIFGALFVGGAANLLNTSRQTSPEDALLAMFQTVRREAVATGRAIQITAVENGAAYVWGEGGQMVLPVRPEVSVRIIKPQLDQAVLIGGLIEENPLDRMWFYPDGTCDPVRVQIQRGRIRRVESIDPWTCSPLPGAASTP